MGKLSEWTQESSRYLKLQDGERIKATFKGYKIITSTFDAEKETVRYTLDTPFGEKLWDTSAKNVALFFDDMEEGQQVLIERSGTGTDTKYKLSIINSDSE